jgi:indolepyruvate ferredoxin oxidoreductase beta subunit
MERKLVIAGIGGQGVVYATKVVAQAALLRGERVLASENHGMSQRGGSVNAHVKIGESAAPLIRRGTADALLAFDAVEALRNLLYVRAGGAVYVGTAGHLPAEVAARLAELGTAVCLLDAAALAQGLGSPAAANLIVLGRAAAHGGLGLSLDDLRAAVQALGPARAVELNFKALALGAAQHEAV